MSKWLKSVVRATVGQARAHGHGGDSENDEPRGLKDDEQELQPRHCWGLGSLPGAGKGSCCRDEGAEPGPVRRGTRYGVGAASWNCEGP